MKERPIIFSTESVRAILDGRKTQTRRVVKPQIDGWEPYRSPEWYTQTAIDRDGMEVPGKEVFGVFSEDGEHGRVCPFGAPGDRLWVRETWRKFDADFDCQCLEQCSCARYPYRYAADYPDGEEWGIWKNPMFMPRKFSRLTLEITDVRCERLQDITEQDAISEGMLLYERWQSDDYKNDVITAKASGTKPPLGFSPKKRFAHLWDKLNAKRGFGWDTNPWVWVIEFKRVEIGETNNGTNVSEL